MFTLPHIPLPVHCTRLQTKHSVTVAPVTSQDLLPEEPPLGKSKETPTGTFSLLFVGLYVPRKAKAQVPCPCDCLSMRLVPLPSPTPDQPEPPQNIK